MARRRRQTLAFPVRRPARAAGASGLLALAALSRRMAARRMAAGRKRAEQILAFDLAGRCRPRNPRCSRQNALADRARLSGTQAGTRPRSLSDLKARRANIGFRPCRPMPTSQPSLQPPKCAGGSSATIRNSSRNSASITIRSESAPSKYWLSTLPADADLATLVAAAKMRWRIERDYQELKQELGLDHYQI